MTPKEIDLKYKEFCNTPSDINYHLPTLRSYYDKCNHITEIGVRGCISLFAALASSAKKVVAIDIYNVWTPDVKKLEFVCKSSLEIEIEQTDFLFVDSLHTYDQLRQELELHHSKVNKWIGFHDTSTFGFNGEDGGKGLLQAIEEFQVKHPEWVREYYTSANNGLTILKRNTIKE